MRKSTKITEFLYEFFDRLLLLVESGKDSPYAIAVGREAYEAMLRKRYREQGSYQPWHLRRHRLVSIREQGNSIIFELTEKGRTEFLKEKIVKTKKRLPKGEYCLVTFDIPEKIRWTRVALRGFLARAHFEQVQKSVWRSPYDVCESMRKFVSNLGGEKWIHVYRSRCL